MRCWRVAALWSRSINGVLTLVIGSAVRDGFLSLLPRKRRSRGTPESPSERLPNRTPDREPSRLDGDSVPVRAACLGLPRRGTRVKPAL